MICWRTPLSQSPPLSKTQSKNRMDINTYVIPYLKTFIEGVKDMK